MKSGTLLLLTRQTAKAIFFTSLQSGIPTLRGSNTASSPPPPLRTSVSHPGDPGVPPSHHSRLPSIQCPGNGRVTADAAEWRLLFPGVKQL